MANEIEKNKDKELSVAMSHPRQKYLLTVKGLALYNELTKKFC